MPNQLATEWTVCESIALWKLYLTTITAWKSLWKSEPRTQCFCGLCLSTPFERDQLWHTMLRHNVAEWSNTQLRFVASAPDCSCDHTIFGWVFILCKTDCHMLYYVRIYAWCNEWCIEIVNQCRASHITFHTQCIYIYHCEQHDNRSYRDKSHQPHVFVCIAQNPIFHAYQLVNQ